jgi:hypothetical protein
VRAILIAAAVGAGAAATAAFFSLRNKRDEHKTLKSAVGKWEDEGGNVPQVPTPSPAPVPQSSVPGGHEASQPSLPS